MYHWIDENKKTCNELPSDYIAAEAAWLAANSGTVHKTDGARRERRAAGDLPVPRVRGSPVAHVPAPEREMFTSKP
jgi:hypothetical protein